MNKLINETEGSVSCPRTLFTGAVLAIIGRLDSFSSHCATKPIVQNCGGIERGPKKCWWMKCL